ncbi:tumor protein p53-inducible nuclear protein 2 isoform X1 [Osmerus eperlanus]|uniref:tumor protein p53-inducible nuclear protein 2 isoform X1 n=1 Tax=Osmerus eperlanus TaxID=29151 RepID=UPI002E15987F
MFQRLSSLFFGEVEEVAAELKGPNPCVTEADEEGWMLVNLPEETDCVMVEGGSDVPLIAQSLPQNNQLDQSDTSSRTDSPDPVPPPPQKRRRTHKPRAQTSESLCCPTASLLASGVATPVTFPRRARLSTPFSPSVSPGSGKGATAETSPMEDLLIEHPSMSVYVSTGNMSMVSNGNLSMVGEESISSLAGSVSRVAEPAAAPATRGSMPTRVTRGLAAQAGSLAKVTQVARVQRGKARTERRHLGRNRIQRQNRTKEQGPRHAAHARNTFLHQPSQRNFCH